MRVGVLDTPELASTPLRVDLQRTRPGGAGEVIGPRLPD